tara:strand:+ start:133 stop:582 length:450 start_codon:yes stop_codon:yes gene_type:complete
MITYIFFGIFISVLLIYLVSKFFNLGYEKFKKYIKFLFFIFLLISILILIRINPNFLSLLPGLLIFFIKWKPVLSILRNFLLFKSRNYQSKDGSMSKDQAYKILGLNNEATKKEILDAYHSLMKKNHPDLGGSDWITSQLNKAKETLLG